MIDVDDEDLIAVGTKVIEMADRVKVMNAACPGAVASWGFEENGTRYMVKVTVDQEHRKAEHEPPQA